MCAHNKHYEPWIGTLYSQLSRKDWLYEPTMVACSVVFDESSDFEVVIGTALIDNVTSLSSYIKLRNKRKLQGKQGSQKH